MCRFAGRSQFVYRGEDDARLGRNNRKDIVETSELTSVYEGSHSTTFVRRYPLGQHRVCARHNRTLQ